MKKVKVLQLGSPSGLYGAERWILALIKNLDSAKVESWVGAIRDNPSGEQVPVCQEAESAGFQTIVFDSPGRISSLAVRLLKDFIRKESIDVVHTHGYKTDIIGLLATIGTKCKVITTPHGWTNQPDFKLRCYEIFDRMIFPFFDAVVPLSSGLYDPLQRIPGLGKKLHLIPNGVDIEEIESVTKISDELSDWRKNELFIIGYIGRLTPGKGLDLLLSSFAKDAEPHWRVAIVGEGEQAEELEFLSKKLRIDDRVIFFGYRPDRLSFLKGFDVFVLPSRSEGIPRCLMEAMAANVPVVASNIPGCRYLVDEGVTGLLFEMDDGNALLGAIKQLDFDKSLGNKLRKNAQKNVNVEFSGKKMAAQYFSLYMDLI